MYPIRTLREWYLWTTRYLCEVDKKVVNLAEGRRWFRLRYFENIKNEKYILNKMVSFKLGTKKVINKHESFVLETKY